VVFLQSKSFQVQDLKGLSQVGEAGFNIKLVGINGGHRRGFGNEFQPFLFGFRRRLLLKAVVKIIRYQDLAGVEARK
jgi:hypothetical protein